MRRLAILAPAALLMLSACAGGASGGGYADDIERLSDSCEARGGILTPTGEMTGRVETEYVCKITGQPARTGN